MKHEKTPIQQQVEKHAPQEDYIPVDARALCREGFTIATPHIVQIAKGEDPDATAAAKVKAHDNLGRYGMGKRIVQINNAHLLLLVYTVTQRHITDRVAYDAWMADLLATFEHRQ